jgi:hypothetical protein
MSLAQIDRKTWKLKAARWAQERAAGEHNALRRLRSDHEEFEERQQRIDGRSLTSTQ